MHNDLQVLIESLCWLGHLQPYERTMASMIQYELDLSSVKN